MPIKPSVFRPIRSHDVHQRPFKAFKRYRLTRIGNTPYVTQSAVYSDFRQDVREVADPRKITYLINKDNSNQHVIWKSLKHRFYTHGGNNFPEHSLNNNTETTLFYSASTLSMPYMDVGERIKPGTVEVSSSWLSGNTPHQINLLDDGEGNLRDTLIATQSFASSSHNIFYMSFNDQFTPFKHPLNGRFNNNGGINYKKKSLKYSSTSNDIILNHVQNLSLLLSCLAI